MILLAGGNDAIPGSGLGARQFSMPRLTACAEKGNSIDKTQQVVVHLSQFADDLIQAGGKLVFCPHCANSAGIGDGALMRNAEIATLPQLAKLLVDADTVIDYSVDMPADQSMNNRRWYV